MHFYKPSYKQGQKKVMRWVGLVNGKILAIHWFEEDGLGQPVFWKRLCGLQYAKLRIPTAMKKLWFQQNGAPSHCTNRALAFLNEKFKSTVISHRCSVP